MASKNVVEEYIVRIRPMFDTKEYEKVQKQYRKKIYKMLNLNDKAEQQKLKEEEQNRKSTLEAAKKLGGSKNIGNALSSFMSSSAGKMAAILSVVKIMYETVNKIADKAEEFSNSMITASSAFVNKSTRSTMATFGVGSQTATGINKVMDLMGITTSDLKTMTSGQLSLFSKLMKQWNEGINSIDKTKLAQFNEVVQNFQSELASAKLELQIQLYKMLVELAPSLETFFTSIIDLIKSLTNLLTSKVMKAAIQTLVEAVSMIVELISWLADIITFLFGGSSTSSSIASTAASSSSSSTSYTVYNSVDARTNNSFTGDTNTMFDLATNVTQQNNKYISTEYLRDGRA